MDRPSDCLLFISLLLWSCGGFLAEESKLIGSDQPILARAGDDVILPCHLEPPIDAADETVKWTKPGLDNQYVYFHEDGRLIFDKQNPAYTFRTRLFTDEMKTGNVSLKISRVNSLDEGEYICRLPSKHKQVSIKLTFGVVCSPIIDFVTINSRSVVLRCSSGGWYPEPEVSWLDAEGHVLSAGPPETVRGPDDLYTVSSRVTVEKRHGNRFTCRVQQKTINQTRETQIQVPDDFFIDQSSPHLYWLIIVPLLLLLLVIAAVIIIKQRKRERERQREREKEREEREKEREELREMGHRMAQLMRLGQPTKILCQEIENLTKQIEDLKKENEELKEELSPDEDKETQIIYQMETENRQKRDQTL